MLFIVIYVIYYLHILNDTRLNGSGSVGLCDLASYVYTQSACTILIKRLSLIYHTHLIMVKHIRPGIKHATLAKFIN